MRKKIFKDSKLSALVSQYLGLDEAIILTDKVDFRGKVLLGFTETTAANLSIVGLDDLMELKLLRHGGFKVNLLHTMNYGIYAHYVAPHIRALENIMPTYCVVNPVTGLNWDSYYVRSLWYRPIVSASVSSEAVLSLIRSNKPIVLVGRGFSKEALSWQKIEG